MKVMDFTEDAPLGFDNLCKLQFVKVIKFGLVFVFHKWLAFI